MSKGDPAPAKPVGNLALRVFQRYYAELCKALSGDPHQMAREMYSKELISEETKSRAVDTLGMPPLDKAGVLVDAIGNRIATENSSQSLMAFCRLLERRPGVGSIAARMKARLAYMERHHRLPPDGWSSDTECQQRPIFLAQDVQQPFENIPPTMQHYSRYLKDLYKEREGMCLKWPQVLMKDYVNLLCVHKEEKGDQQDKKLTEDLVHGHIKKIQKERESIAITDLTITKDGSRPKCILVQGAPGSGKTMFSWEVSQKWSQGELLHQYPLVVMLALRDPDFQNASFLEDLFPHDSKPFQQEVAEAVRHEAGKGVLLLLDGFDELPVDKRNESSLWMKLITGKLLRLATVMVTSRPWAIKTLLEPEYSPRISQHIEIVGFTDKNINDYIRKAFPDATEESKFCKYLATQPHIRSTMYIPLNCAIVVDVYRSSGPTSPAPKTMTQLYTALVRGLLMRYMKSNPKGPTLGITEHLASKFLWRSKTDFFKDIPPNVYQKLCKISRLAYKGLCNKQQLIFSDLPADYETLGLLQRVPQLYNAEKMSVSYNFLHLTVQEFLAAFHILLQGRREQHKIFSGEVIMEEDDEASSDGDTNSLEDEGEKEDEEKRSSTDVVRMFIGGLSGLKKSRRSVPVHIRDKDKAILHALFESQNESLVSSELGNEDTVRTVDLDYTSFHDVFVLGYCISLSSCQWELSLRFIGDKHVEVMKSAITSWEYGKGRIIKVDYGYALTSDGLSHLLSLPQHTLSGLRKLDLSNNKLDFECYCMLARHLSSLPHLEVLFLFYNKIDFEGEQSLLQSLDTNTTLRDLWLPGNGIRDRGGCNLAKVWSKNKNLERLILIQNPLGKESIRQLIDSLQHNHTLRWMTLPKQWSEFGQHCVEYNKVENRIIFN